MDRRMVDTSALPQDLDINQNAQFAMVALGYLAQAVMGSASWVQGLTPSAATPASLTVNFGPGSLGQMTVVDQQNPGTSAIANTTDPLMKIGINTASTALTFAAPVTAGQSQVFLIQGQMQEVDGGAAALPYYNATTPSQPFSGPANSGASTNTLRTQRVVLQSVAGAPAATGAQTAPGVTGGWVPLYTVTLSNGQTTITAGQVVQHVSAPFLPFTVPQLTPGTYRTQSYPVAGSYTWICPIGVTRLRATVVGGGGGGCDCIASSNPASSNSGSGGGAGGYAEGWITVTPGAAYTIIVGTGGTAQVTGGTSSAMGLSATGGGGASFTGGGISPGGIPGIGAGGNILTCSGGYGSDGQSGAYHFAGNGAPGPYGGGGRAGDGLGANGTAPGAGGGGAYDSMSSGVLKMGGLGAPGLIMLDY